MTIAGLKVISEFEHGNHIDDVIMPTTTTTIATAITIATKKTTKLYTQETTKDLYALQQRHVMFYSLVNVVWRKTVEN